MEDFIRALQARLGRSLRLNTDVHTLPEGPVALCTDAHTAGTLLHDLDPELALRLRAVRYAPLVSATVWVRVEDFSKSVRGVGMLYSPSEKSPLLGVLFNSSAFPGRTLEPGICSFTAMLGGTANPEALALTDQEIEEKIRAEFAARLGWRGRTVEMKIHRWPRAVPVYSEELRSTLEFARERLSRHKGLILFGNYTGDVSIRGMMEATRGLKRDGA
jgi:protoporphyrinogen oxidase